MPENTDFNLREGAVALNVGWYEPTSPPVADTQELADAGRRIILYFAPRADSIRISIAPKGVMYAGWVIGTVKE